MRKKGSMFLPVIVLIVVTSILGACAPPATSVEPVASDPATVTVPSEPTNTSIPTEPPMPSPEPTKAPIPIITFEDLAGIWVRKFKGFDYKFEVDKEGGAKVTVMFITPQNLSWVEGKLHVLNGLEFPECPVNTLGIYEVSGVPGEYLIFTLVEDPCLGTRGFKGKWTEASLQ